MDIPALHRRAVAEFDARVKAVGADQWGLATPCEDWDVRALVNHVVGEDLWTAPLMAGSTIAEVGDRFDGDLLGKDPLAAWSPAADGAVAAVAEPGAMERTVHLSFGDVPAGDYVLQLFADHLIHAFDLARAIGGDERLDPELVGACAEWFDANEAGYRAAGAIGPALVPAPDAGAQEKLLARFGRA